MICGFVENHGHPMLFSLQIIAMLTWKEMPSVENLQIVCWVNQWLSNFFRLRRTKKITKTFAAHLLPNKVALKNSCVGCDCFREQIRLKRGSVVVKHTHILLSIPRSLSFFCFYFLSEQKIHIHRAVNMPIPRIILISLHRSLNRICKQMAKSRPSCFGETMHEKTGRFVRQWAAWAFAEFFPGGTISTVCLSFCWLMDVQ